jgi:hypothetical protein
MGNRPRASASACKRRLRGHACSTDPVFEYGWPLPWMRNPAESDPTRRHVQMSTAIRFGARRLRSLGPEGSETAGLESRGRRCMTTKRAAQRALRSDPRPSVCDTPVTQTTDSSANQQVNGRSCKSKRIPDKEDLETLSDRIEKRYGDL